MPDPKLHWESAYESKAATEVSWYEPVPRHSLGLIKAADLPQGAAIIDVGGGASTLVDNLLSAGFGDIAVLDLATASLGEARARLGAEGDHVEWIAADVTTWKPVRRYDLWHDRAVFHFLVDPSSREMYLKTLRAALSPGGHVVMATFGPEGPTRCSGLDVQRYSADELSAVLGPAFRLVTTRISEHLTPGGCVQQFVYGLWRLEA
jgi:2-polyprenyl-3-methyl-5-hydroxy-6-metoxy-1,4-benzoquinol methylase